MIFIAEIVLRLFFRFRNGIHTTNPNGVERLIAPGETLSLIHILLHRSWGGILAGALFVLPSLFLLIALSWLYLVFGQTALVARLFYGLTPAVTAIVLKAAWRIGG